MKLITGTFRRLAKAAQHSCAGLGHALRHEHAFQLEAIALVAAVPIAWYLANSLTWFVVLVAAVLAVMVVEILNTAIEQVCNAVSRDYREEIKVAKDCGSAAVLIMTIISSAIWACAFWNFFVSS